MATARRRCWPHRSLMRGSGSVNRHLLSSIFLTRRSAAFSLGHDEPHLSTGSPLVSDDDPPVTRKRSASAVADTEILLTTNRQSPESASVRAALAAQLVQSRKLAGLTQMDVSERLGKPRSWIAKLERGNRGLLFSEAIVLARLYGIEVGALVPRGSSAGR